MLNDPYSCRRFAPCYEPLSIGASIAALATAATEAATATIAGTSLATASSALTGAGTVVSTAGVLMKGAADKEAAEYKAKEFEIAATEAKASSQRSAYERRQAAKLTLSKLQANAAAFAGDATNPGIVNLAGDIAQRGEYLALSEMYAGEERARGLRDEAAASRASGRASQIGSYFSAGGTLASGFGSMLSTYAKLRPDALGNAKTLAQN